MGKLILDECVFDCGIAAVRAPSDMDILAKKTQFLGAGVGFDLFEPRIQEIVGLPDGVDKKLVQEVLVLLKQKPDASPEEMTEVVQKSRLGIWLGNTESITKVATGLIALIKAGAEFLQ
ncbi:hypothetical protein [Pseudomonas koreensis]|uniref:hypothetical protein n=1 Tax=Pseudomonas koreensis TaxID=198620 RepID=UPI003D9929F5